MTYSKFSYLHPGQWLNDEIINFYMCMLQERDDRLCAESGGRRRSSHFFNSFFLDRLMDQKATYQYTYRNVKRWSKKFDVFEKDKIFFPVNLNNTHWTMAAVFVQRREIWYCDSMCGSGMKWLKALLRWLQDESREKKGVELAGVDEWKLVNNPPGYPRQTNGHDCGMFSCMCADCLTDDLPFSEVYHQSRMDEIRVRTGAAIIRGSLPY